MGYGRNGVTRACDQARTVVIRADGAGTADLNQRAAATCDEPKDREGICAADINFAVRNRRDGELDRPTATITRPCLVAVIKLLRQIIGIIGVQRRGRAIAVSIGLKSPNDGIVGAVGRN